MSLPAFGNQANVVRPSLAPAKPESHGIPAHIFYHYYEECKKGSHGDALKAVGERFRATYCADTNGSKTWGAITSSLSDCLFDVFKPVIIHEYKQGVSPWAIVRNLSEKPLFYPFGASVTGAKIEQWSKDPSNGLLYRTKKNTSKTQETSSGPTDPVPPIPNNEYGRNSHDAWSFDGLSSEFPYAAAFCHITQESGLTADSSDFLIDSGLWDQEIDTQPYFNRPLEPNDLVADNEPARDTFNSQLPQALPPAPNTGSIGASNEPIHPQSTANLGQRELLRGDHNVGQVGQTSADQLLSQGQQTATHSLSMHKEESVVQYLRMEVARLQNEVETKKRKIQALESRNDQLGRENEKLKVARLKSTAERPEPRYDQLGRQSERVEPARLMSPIELSKLGDAAAPTTPVPRQRLNTKRNAPGMPRRNAPRLPASRQSIYRYPPSSQGSLASWKNISSPAQHTSAVGDRSSMATSPFNNHTISSHSDTPFSLLPEAVGSRRNSTSSTAPSSDDDLAQASRRRRANGERYLGIGAVDEWRNGSLPQRLLIRQIGADREEDLSRYLTRLNLRQDEF